jgi:hypothetical protein
MTLQQLYDQHPEWRGLEMVVYCTDGHYDFIGAAGAVYVGEYFGEPANGEECIEGTGQKVLVFSAN